MAAVDDVDMVSGTGEEILSTAVSLDDGADDEFPTESLSPTKSISAAVAAPPADDTAALAGPSSSSTLSNRIVQLSPEDPFDLDTYLAPYNGARAKVPRLIHIAKHCPQLRVQAATEAAQLIKQETLDVNRYRHVINLGNSTVSGEPVPPAEKIAPDEAWISEKTATIKSDGEKLELELRNYQNNLIKESIRMANRDLADHFRRCGSLPEALKCYQRTRDFCSTSEHVIEMCLSVIEVSLELQNYGNVATFVSKAEGVLESYNPSAAVGSSMGRLNGANGSSSIGPPSKGATTAGADAIGALFRAGGSAASTSQRAAAAPPGAGEAAQARIKKTVAQIRAKLQIADGLAALGSGRYESAAMNFLASDPQFADSYSHVVSAGDVALYTVLCSLAVFPRSTLKNNVVERASLRGFVAHEPHTKDLLDAFWSCDYKRGLGLLEKWKSRHLLDINLYPHLYQLTAAIMHRCLTQFISPFSSISLDRLGSAFGWSLEQTQYQVLNLVETKALSTDTATFKLDWVDGILLRKEKDPRGELFATTMRVGQERVKTMQKLWLRMQVVKHGLTYREEEEQRSSGGGGGGGGGGQQQQQQQEVIVNQGEARSS